jgi:Holliday junction resolvase RusA-like endonuclease
VAGGGVGVSLLSFLDERPPGVLIPLPPTANNIWRIFGSRQHKSALYTKWLAECAELVAEEMRPVVGPICITVTIRLGKGFPKSRDLDNCVKPCIDLLKPTSYKRNGDVASVGAAIIEDDSVEYVRRIVAEVIPAYDKKSDAECYVFVEPFPGTGPARKQSK